MRRRPSALIASGFSQNTGLPAAIAASILFVCRIPRGDKDSVDIAGLDNIVAVGVDFRLHARRATAARALSALISDTATTVAPCKTGYNDGYVLSRWRQRR